MPKMTKKKMANLERLEPGKAYALDDAVPLLQSFQRAKFVEAVDVSVNLGVDPRKSDQVVRGSKVLPHGTGRSMRVAVFAQGEQAEKALAAGADRVGYDDLADDIKKGLLDFDLLVATPDSMRLVGQLGQILGPRGLMPNPKVGTVAADVEQAVKNAKAGQVRFRTDKAGVIHATIARVDFEVDAIKENLVALLTELKKCKPASSKGQYFQKLTLSTTMGPGIIVDLASLPKI